ncbi:MAG: hypothetical protein L0177_10375, partial [Chloroflexi bacterium]|nr:hypothetical protein [Chloroflexota bacterium]
QKITDRVDAYNWIAQNHAQLLGSQYVTGLDVSQVAPAYDRLVTLSLEVLDARQVPLEKLIKLRMREIKTGGSDYSALRRRYLYALQSHIGRIAKDAKSATDLRELERQFKEDIKQDLSDLKSELGLAGKKALLSKEVALGALIAAGSLAMPITGLTALPSEVGGLGVVPLTKALVEYRGARREVLRKHTMSWLYLASRKGIPLR